jgi:hypothetical protein
VHVALARHPQLYLSRTKEPKFFLADGREALIPDPIEDVRRLESLTGESFANWLDAHRDGRRSALVPQGRTGTAHNSIDRPIRD